MRPGAESALLVRAASGEAEEARGAVRVTASEVVGAEVLPPLFASFRERHPRIIVELLLSNQTEDLLRREADIAVRMVRPTQSALVSRSLGKVRRGFHAHRRYVEANGLPATLEALSEHAVIGFDLETASVRSARALGVTLSREMFAFRCDSDLAQLAAIRAGFGISPPRRFGGRFGVPVWWSPGDRR